MGAAAFPFSEGKREVRESCDRTEDVMELADATRPISPLEPERKSAFDAHLSTRFTN
jgi:hypothetical protein